MTEQKQANEIMTVNADKIALMTGFSAEEVAVIKKTVAKDTTDVELAYFLNVCKSVQLNPFLKQIWCFKDKRGNLLIFAGRDGYLEIAQRDSRWDGMISSYVCEKDTFTMDVANGKVSHTYGLDRGKIAGGYCIVKPKGLSVATVEWAEMSEYKPKNASEYSPWSGTPGIMIQKCAEVHALKKAFGISGLQSEFDFTEKNGVAIPIQEANSVDVIEDYKAKIVDALDQYQGEDKEEIQAMCAEKVQAGEFTETFAKVVAEQLSIEL